MHKLMTTGSKHDNSRLINTDSRVRRAEFQNMWSDPYATLRIGTVPEIIDFDRALTFQPDRYAHKCMNASIQHLCAYLSAVNSNNQTQIAIFFYKTLVIVT